MALYLKPPRGMIDFHVLQKCVDERLKFFGNMTALSVSIHNVEYLYEDSAFDRAGHFTLRLAAVKQADFLYFLINSETQLLKLRLDSYNCDSVRLFLRNQLRHARECLTEGGISEKIITYLNILTSVLTKMLTRSYRAHVFDAAHRKNDKCKIFTLNVPFQHCASLISKHQFVLRNGYVQIPCEKWKDLLISFFRTYLIVAINEMHYSKNVQIALEDDRIKSILASVCTSENIINNSSISLSNIDRESKLFPLCMQHLQGVLQKNHRLAHEERFNLSLFLKDIGLSLNDSVAYWKTEYSKEHAACSKCSHNWHQDEKKYIYSIRHLYGLEGSRKSYKTRSCNYFQNMIVSPIQEGGCPFKHFDSRKLKTLISTHLNGDENNINNVLLERNRSPLSACNLFLKIVYGDLLAINDSTMSDNSAASSSNCDISFNNPLQYFFLTKSIFNK